MAKLIALILTISPMMKQVLHPTAQKLPLFLDYETEETESSYQSDDYSDATVWS